METESTTLNCITYSCTIDAYEYEHLHEFIWRQLKKLFNKIKSWKQQFLKSN